MVAILPLIGAWVIWIPAAVFLMITGDLVQGLAMLVIGTFVVRGVDNVVRPLLVARESNLNGSLFVISLFGGISAFGFVGIVLGPLLAAITIAILTEYRKSLRQTTDPTIQPQVTSRLQSRADR